MKYFRKGILSVIMLICMLIPMCSIFAAEVPSFSDVSVHDPSVIKVNGTYYIFGSHLAVAKSDDLMHWTQMNDVVKNNNTIIPNVYSELGEAFKWAQSDTLWAPDVIQLADGKYYMYYNACKGDSPVSAMGIAKADNVEGPYKNQGIFLKSGMWGQKSEDGTIYDGNIHPNAVDPNVFYDKNGGLWMVYGSYSGGIFVLELNPFTGLPLPGQGYGKKIMGGYHVRIEGAYMTYDPQTDYYYLFASFGGLSADGGYNLRVARCKTPNGTFKDISGQNMINATAWNGSPIFNDDAIKGYGNKVMGNFSFTNLTGDSNFKEYGYVSSGHNSVYYDEDTRQYFNIFHTRFPNMGELHQVRVHQMFMNKDGWLVVAPHRYTEEKIKRVQKQDIVGGYHYINHGKEITDSITPSVYISLNADNSITGSVTGTWKLVDDYYAEIKIQEGSGTQTYKGVFIKQWDESSSQYVMCFTALSKNGVTIWGSGLNASNNTVEGAVLEEGVSYMLKNVNSGLYLDVTNGVAENGTNVQQWGASEAGAYNTWKVEAAGNGYYKLYSAVGDGTYLLDVANNSAEDGTNIQIWQDTGADAQLFKFYEEDDGTYSILTKASGDQSALDVYEYSTSNGGNICQWTYAGGANQRWILEKVQKTIPNGKYTLQNVNSGLYLDVTNGTAANGTNVQQWEAAGASIYNTWRFEAVGDGYYKIYSVVGDGNYLLDVDYGKTEDGTNIQIYQDTNSDAQLFKFIDCGDGSYGIVTKVSGDASGLDVYDFGTTNGTNVCEWTYYGNDNQRWYIKRVN